MCDFDFSLMLLKFDISTDYILSYNFVPINLTYNQSNLNNKANTDVVNDCILTCKN